MKKNDYIKPGIKSLRLADDLLGNIVETSSTYFGDLHESGGSGIPLSKKNDVSSDDDGDGSSVVDWDD